MSLSLIIYRILVLPCHTLIIIIQKENKKELKIQEEKSPGLLEPHTSLVIDYHSTCPSPFPSSHHVPCILHTKHNELKHEKNKDIEMM